MYWAFYRNATPIIQSSNFRKGGLLSLGKKT